MARTTYRAVCVALGKRIRSLREMRGLSRLQLSQRAGIHIDHLAELERGKKRIRADNDVNPRLETLYRIASTLGVSVDDLFPSPAAGDTAVTNLDQQLLAVVRGRPDRDLRKARRLLLALFVDEDS